MASPLFPGKATLALPLIGAPMFIVSGPELVIAQCKAGIVGTMPSLSVRPAEALDGALTHIREGLAAHDREHPERPAAPFGINLISHKTNARLAHDLEVCIHHRVPLIITSLGPSRRVVERVHAYGGVVFHDVINIRHARKAVAEGVDGIIAVATGAGGHAGTLSPFALVGEIRKIFKGWIALSGAMSTGAHVAAAIAMGADFAYMGTRFIATSEAQASDDYKAMVLESTAADIVYSPYFTGVHGNYLRPSIAKAGFDPDALPARDADSMDIATRVDKPKAWKDVWSAGQGVGAIDDIPTLEMLVKRLRGEFLQAGNRLNAFRSGANGIPFDERNSDENLSRPGR